MAKRSAPDVMTLTVRERLLLFCVGSSTSLQPAGIPEETVTAMTVRGFISRDALGRLALTNSGRAALRALLPDL